ncbi:MAG: PTS sugar transporter subunit IIB [Calditrichaeota bacterium]|nr:PTS sugar transporter subunit IIB [Calditrichota bacterium]
MSSGQLIWRIDDRLIHGQVIIGWVGQLPIKRLIVSDDEIARTTWEKNLLLMASPPGLPTEILSIAETANHYTKWETSQKITMILMRSVACLKKLVDAGVRIGEVNIGGIHYREDRKEFLSYLYLSEEEIKTLKDLMQKGISFKCQDVPSASTHNLEKLLYKRK